MIFWGLRSRCTAPSRWASARPSQTCRAFHEPLQILSGDIFHRDVVDEVGLAQVVHPADVAVGDFPGEFQFVFEPLDRLFLDADFGADQLEGDHLADLMVVDFENFAHAALAELFDDLVPAGQAVSPGHLDCRGPDRLRTVRSRAGDRVLQGCRAAGAKTAVRGIGRPASRTNNFGPGGGRRSGRSGGGRALRSLFFHFGGSHGSDSYYPGDGRLVKPAGDSGFLSSLSRHKLSTCLHAWFPRRWGGVRPRDNNAGGSKRKD
jgi:hypothetical protein